MTQEVRQFTLSLGPFQGITDVVFRNTFTKHFKGVDKLYTPFFTSIEKDRAKNLQTDEIDPKHNDIDKLTPQILSNDADEIIRFARQCKSMGYKEINLNLGCPFARVANKKRGSGLLPYPEIVEPMFENIFGHIDMTFSVKCRLGYFDSDEIVPLIDIFNRYPLSELIIHPRIGKQLYKGDADVQRFSELIPCIKAPLVYNGDIVSKESFEDIRTAVQPVNQFMLGRGLLANPFLAEEIKGLETGDKTRRFESFVNDIFEERLRHTGGSPKVLGRMKELWSYMMFSFDDPQQVWRKLKKINDMKEYESAVVELFRDIKLSI